MAYAIAMGIRIRAPRPTVFEHFLKSHLLSRWFCAWAQPVPKVGGTLKFGGDTCIVLPDGPGWTCEIVAGDVQRRVRFRWPLWGADTEVDWSLEDADDGTVMRLAHEGLPRADSTCGPFRDAWRICLGNLKAAAEGREDALRPDSSPIPGGEFAFDAWFHEPRERVFRALVDSQDLDAWIAGPSRGGSASVEPREGGAYSWGRDEGPRKILKISEPEVLAFDVPAGSTDTKVEWKLEDRGEMTLLRFRHSGFEPGDPRAVAMRCMWSAAIVGLKNYLEGDGVGFTEPYGEQLRAD